MEDEIILEAGAEPSEEMTAGQEADFEAEFEGKAQVADTEMKKEAQKDDADISGEDIEKELTQKDVPTQGISVSVDGTEYTFSREELEDYKPSATHEQEVIEKAAREAGVELDVILRGIEGSLDETKRAKREEQLVEQGYDADMAQHISYIERENAQFKNGRMDTKTGEEQMIRAGIGEFEAMYPEVEALPSAVVRDIRAGATPAAAYGRYLLAERECEIDELRKEKKNREAAAGSVRSAGAAVEDPFITELMK